MTEDGFAKLDAKLADFGKMADVIEHEIAPEICQDMREKAGYALKVQVYSRPESWYRRTRNLEQSVMAAPNIIERDGETKVAMGIETSAEYAKYIEFGTGPRGSAEYDGHESEGVTFKNRMSWLFEDLDGEIRIGKSQEPRPFMRPALYDNVDIYTEWITDRLLEAFQ